MRDGRSLSLTVFKNQQTGVGEAEDQMKNRQQFSDGLVTGHPELKGGPSKDMSASTYLEPMNMTLFGKRVSAGVIKLRILVRDHAGWFRLTINPMTSVCVFSITIYLAILGLNCSMQDLWSLLWHEGSFSFSCGVKILSCSMWDLVLWPGIKPRPPSLGAWSLSHRTTSEVLTSVLIRGRPGEIWDREEKTIWSCRWRLEWCSHESKKGRSYHGQTVC